jgi:AraC-like DNA-binding protein
MSKSDKKGEKRMGRPPVELTPEQVRNAARCALTMDEMAAVLGCSSRTLERRFHQRAYAEAYEQGQELAKADIKRLLFRAGHQGSVKALQFLANNLLGWSDKVTSTVDQSVSYVVEMPSMMDEGQWLESFASGARALPPPTVDAPDIPVKMKTIPIPPKSLR